MKTKKNFKKAGPGRRLIDSAPVNAGTLKSMSSSAEKNSSSSRGEALSTERIANADFAAQAAYKRMNLGVKQETATQRNIRLQALKELEKEKLRENISANEDSFSGEHANNDTCRRDERTFEHSDVIKKVYFTCELLGEDVKLTKDELRENLEDFLRCQLEDDAIVASSLMISSLNSEKKRQLASETLQKYIQNLIEHPGESKFCRIRMLNKAFQERILPVKGAVEFLVGCGFEECLQQNDGSSSPEKFLVIEAEKVNDVAALIQALEVLRSAEPIPIKLYRDPVIFKADKSKKVFSSNAEIPSDFFQLSLEEIKAEQAARSLQAERMLTLRTKEMRLRDETLRCYTYKYTVIRIRFPDNYFLQGTFDCLEELAAVREFISKYVVYTEVPLFSLKDAGTGKLFNEENKSLKELNLVPAALLNFEWDADVLGSFTTTGKQVQYLHEQYISMAKSLE